MKKTIYSCLIIILVVVLIIIFSQYRKCKSSAKENTISFTPSIEHYECNGEDHNDDPDDPDDKKIYIHSNNNVELNINLKEDGQCVELKKVKKKQC